MMALVVILKSKKVVYLLSQCFLESIIKAFENTFAMKRTDVYDSEIIDL